MNKSKLFITLRILISLSLLALLLWLAKKDLVEICQRLRSVNIPILALAFLFFLSSVIFMAWRLRILLAAQKAHFRIKDLFSLTLIGYFFTNFMPTSVGGDIVKGYYISRKIKSKTTSYTAVFIDRAIGLFSFALIASITLVIMRGQIEHKFIFWVIALLLVCYVILIFLLPNKKIVKRIGTYLGIARLLRRLKLEHAVKKVYNAVNIYKNHKGKILQAFALSLAAQFMAFFSVYLLSVSLSAHLPFGKVLLVMPVIFILCMLPITLNGLGLREAGFKFFFSPNIGEAAALSLSLLYLGTFLLTSLIGGIIYLLRK